MPLGAGLCPAGTSPAGIGALETAPAPNMTPLPDPRTGLSQTGRNIAQAVGGGDYTMTADGRLEGMPTVNQLVLIAIQSIDTSTLTEKGPDFASKFTALVQNALAVLIAQKLVQIRSVQIIDRQPGMNPDAGIAIVSWQDLTAGPNAEPQTTTIT